MVVEHRPSSTPHHHRSTINTEEEAMEEEPIRPWTLRELFEDVEMDLPERDRTYYRDGEAVECEADPCRDEERQTFTWDTYDRAHFPEVDGQTHVVHEGCCLDCRLEQSIDQMLDRHGSLER
jgi:hypothetical protein